MSGKMQELFFITLLGMNCRHLKHTARQRARFVKHHGINFRKGIHVVRTFDKNTATGSTADAAKECERNRDDEGAGT